jgi:hypothetical protein
MFASAKHLVSAPNKIRHAWRRASDLGLSAGF